MRHDQRSHLFGRIFVAEVIIEVMLHGGNVQFTTRPLHHPSIAHPNFVFVFVFLVHYILCFVYFICYFQTVNFAIKFATSSASSSSGSPSGSLSSRDWNTESNPASANTF